MFGHKRKPKLKNKRNHKRRLIAFYSVIAGSSLLLLAGISVVLYLQQQDPLVVSPITSVKALSVHEDEKVMVIKKALREKTILYKEVESKDAHYIIRLENGEEVTLSAKKDILAQISSLHFILARLTMEGRQFSSLDLQFDKPIIVFKD